MNMNVVQQRPLPANIGTQFTFSLSFILSPVALCPCFDKGHVASLLWLKYLLFSQFLRAGLWVVDRRHVRNWTPHILP